MKGRIAAACLVCLATLLVAYHTPAQTQPQTKAADYKAEYDKAVARAKSLGLPTSSKDTLPPVPDDQNAALSDAFDAKKNPLPQFPNDSHPTLEQIQKVIEEGKENASKVVAVSHFKFYRPAQESDDFISFPIYAAFKSWAKYLVMKAKVDSVNHNLDAAKEDFLTCTRLATLVGQDPNHIGVLVQIAINSIVERGAHDLVKDAKFSQPSIDLARTVIDALPEPSFYSLVTKGIAYDLSQIENTVNGLNTKFENYKAQGQATGMSPLSLYRCLAAYLNDRCDIVEILQANSQDILAAHKAIAKLEDGPDYQSDDDDAIEYWDSNGNVDPKKFEEAKTQLVNLLAHSIPGSQLQSAIIRATANKRLGILGLDILAYKNANGHLPQSLSDLKTKTIVADPWSHKPFLYKVKGDGFLLYSVGVDQKDDGGMYDQLPNKDITFQTVALARPLLTNGQ